MVFEYIHSKKMCTLGDAENILKIRFLVSAKVRVCDFAFSIVHSSVFNIS